MAALDFPASPALGQLYAGYVWNGETWLRATSADVTAIGTHGQCMLQFISASAIRLYPWNGDRLTINGISRVIPQAGVTLASTGIVPDLYYIYAYMSGETMMLQAVTKAAAPAMVGPGGIVVKQSDPAYTLVGMIYPTATATFHANYVRSWFNRRATTNPASWVGPADILATSTQFLANNVLAWQGERVRGEATARWWPLTTANTITLTMTKDGAQVLSMFCASLADYNNTTFFAHDALAATDGLHSFATQGVGSATSYIRLYSGTLNCSVGP